MPFALSAFRAVERKAISVCATILLRSLCQTVVFYLRIRKHFSALRVNIVERDLNKPLDLVAELPGFLQRLAARMPQKLLNMPMFLEMQPNGSRKTLLKMLLSIFNASALCPIVNLDSLGIPEFPIGYDQDTEVDSYGLLPSIVG